jgi:predicted RNA binding protein YcfA (HicA-like mRNA interferase family)
MNAKHQKTLSMLFATPTPRSVSFRDASALLVALGCVIQQGRGSRIRFIHGKTILTLHVPHPGKEIKEYQVKMMRDFLTTIGVAP